MDSVSGLPCMNCGKATGESEGKVFAEVFVCPVCYEMAERLYAKCEGELRRLLLLLREAIRIALVEGKLVLSEGVPLDELPKEDLLKMITVLSEKKNGSARRPVSG